MSIQRSVYSIFTVGILLGISSLKLSAQQDIYYTNYMFNRLTFNPAYAGNNSDDGRMCATIINKNQWLGWGPKKEGGAPVTQNINLNAPLGSHHGLGINIENDKIGFENNLNAVLSYAYKITMNGQQSLTIGASGGFMQKGLAGDKLKSLSYLLSGTQDPNIVSSQSQAIKPDFGAGVYYRKQNLGKLNDFYAGLSAKHLVAADMSYYSTASPTGSGFNIAKMVTHIYATAGAQLPLGANVLEPSFFLRTDTKKWQVDFNANYLMNNKYWVGASFHTDTKTFDAFNILAGMKFTNSLKAGISYDITATRLGPSQGNSYGTVEIMLQYCFKFMPVAQPPQKFFDTRRTDGWR
jgi:type IX secretion system PorP/SprF family membrane protein